MGSRANTFIAAGLAFGGTALLIAIFAFTTRATDPRKGKLLTADIEELATGTYMTVDTNALRYYVIRPAAGELYVVAAPLIEGAVPMPETFWWKPIIRCRDFGINGDSNKITDASRFQCRDAGQPEEWANRWQWDIRGQHVPDERNTPIDNLYRVRINQSDDEVVFTGLESD